MATEALNKKFNRLRDVILPVLKCIACGNSNLTLTPECLQCKSCAQTYTVRDAVPIMLKDPASAFGFTPEVIVAHPYSAQWKSLINAAKSGLVLDLGAGNNPDSHDNVIKLDIFAVPNVDIVAYAEALPFKDYTFKIVMSGAVFEHVENIKLATENVYNVLESNGQVYIETAFLQPVHAYPHHYYNMTLMGLESLFTRFTKISSGVQRHQYPTFALTWLLSEWVRRLPDEQRRKFLSATVDEILNEHALDLFSTRWMDGFKKKDLEDLACGVYIYASKARHIHSAAIADLPAPDSCPLIARHAKKNFRQRIRSVLKWLHIK